MPGTFRPRGAPTDSERRRAFDARRGTASERGYGWKWQKARLAYLKAHPLCVVCQAEGVVKAADTVDHKVPHKGDRELFWDADNWQSLCAEHHNREKQRQERKG